MNGNLEDLLIDISSSFLKDDNGDGGNHSSNCRIEADMAKFTKIFRLIKRNLSNRNERAKIFDNSFRPQLGHLVFILFDLFVNSKIDINLRLKCCKILLLLLDPNYREYSADFIAFILPGIFARCQKILLETNESHSLVASTTAGLLAANAICISFSQLEDQNVENRWETLEGLPLLEFKRSAGWIQMAKGKILPQLSSLLSRLCVHQVDAIRFESMQMVARIQEHAILDDQFDKITLDVIAQLYNDTYPKTKELARIVHDQLNSPQRKATLETYTIGKLSKNIKSLPKDMHNASNGGLRFQNFLNLLEIIGTKLLDRLLNSSDFVCQLLSSLINVIEVDTNKEVILSDKVLKLPALKHGINLEQLKLLAQTFINTSNFEVLLDWLIDEFSSDIALNRKTSVAYLVYAFSSVLSVSNRAEEGHLHQFAVNVLELLRSLSGVVEEEVMDERIVSECGANAQESCLVQLLISCFSSFRFSGNNIWGARLRVDVLYEVLKWCSSSDFGARNCSEHALNELARDHPNVSSFLVDNARQMVFKLGSDSHCFSAIPRFALVLAELVTRCSDPAMFLRVRDVVSEILLWLDRSDQKKTLLLLRALRSYSKALLAWFPDLMPKRKEDEATIGEDNVSSGGEEEIDRSTAEKLYEYGKDAYEGDPNYSLIKDVVSILNRTKQFVSSPHLPIQIIVLDVLQTSLQFVRNYENELLPMVHQNWHGLVRKFDQRSLAGGLTDSEKLVAAKSVEVVENMCRLSGEFVHWKIVQEFMPRILLILRQLFAQSTNLGTIYSQTATFKLQCAILSNMFSIVSLSQLSVENLKPLKEELQNYVEEKKLPSEVRVKAKEAFALVNSMK